MNHQRNRLSLAISAVLFSGIFPFSYAANLPTDGQVTHGNAAINTSGNQMMIEQSTPKVNIDWQSFDVAPNHGVEFKQPSADAVAFNRVKGGNASQIQGRLTANGKVFLSNPNGVIFSKDAQVNVGSLLATTKELEDGQDIAHSHRFKFVRKTDKEGEINNQAHIVVDSKNGFVVLVGDNVKNEGSIEVKPFEKTETKESWYCTGGDDWICDDPWLADYYGASWKKTTETVKTQTQGQILLAAGDSFTLNLEDNYVNLNVDPNTMAGIVKNDGILIANDGRIELTAAGKDRALSAVVNNNGLLQANQIKIGKSGTITLSADNVVLDSQSDIQSDNKLTLTAANADLKLQAKKGAKITVKETEINANKLNIAGQFGRADSNDYFNSEFQKQNNRISVKTKGVVSINDNESDDTADSHIQNSALASMLESSGQVNLETDTPYVDGKYRYDLAGFTWSGNLNVEPYRGSDALLIINTPSYVKMNNAHIQAKNGRLSIGTELWNFRPNNKPEEVDASVSISDSQLDLNNGSFGVARDLISRYRVWYADNAISAEEDQRSYYDFNLTNTHLANVDEFFIGGGFGKVNIDGLHHNGRMNTYINGGNDRTDLGYYEYGLRDLKERLTRSAKDQTRRRWNFNSKSGNLDLDQLVNFEVSQVFDGWFVGKYQADDPLNTLYSRHHLDTEININNSDITSQNGFIHLMAKKINIGNSDLTVNFDKQLVGAEANVNKIGINAEQTVLDNSHLRVEGADLKDISPNDGFATFYLIGDLLGKNKSSIFTRSHQGYTMMTNGDVTMKGEKTPDDLKITVINTGGYAQADGSDLGTANADDYLSSRGFVAGNTPRKKTVLENAVMQVLAPNGSEAYKTENTLPFEVKDNATFNFFEKTRVRGTDLAKIDGKGGNLLSERQYLRAFDRAYGIAPTNLSHEQAQHIADHKLAKKEPVTSDFVEEKVVNLSVCNEKGSCEDETLGNKHSDAKVSVGEVRAY